VDVLCVGIIPFVAFFIGKGAGVVRRTQQTQVLLAAVGVFLGACPILSAADGGIPSKSLEEIKCLVSRLGSKHFKDREEAARELSQLGRAALPSLQEAALSPNAELRHRAQRLAERIEAPAQLLSNPIPSPTILLKSFC
jgi:hypothetical protein